MTDTVSEVFTRALSGGYVTNRVLEGTVDAFARQRVSEPYNLFDTQNQYNLSPLYWDSIVVTGGSASHLPNESSILMSVDGTANGKITRQTRAYVRYQPGKSQLILLTGVFGAAATNVRRRMGYFDAQNGIFLEQTSAGLFIVKRSYATGAAVDTRVAQADWNIETLTGTGDVRATLDMSKAQIFLIDIEWLGVGRVRCGFVIDGAPVYVHEFLHANSVTTVYMTTANLPLRYELESTAASSAATMRQICASVQSEGGAQERGFPMSAGNRNTLRTVANTLLPVCSLTLDTVWPSGGTIANRTQVKPVSVELTTASAPIYWELLLNATLTGASFAAVDTTHSGVKVDVSASSLSGGVRIDGGYVVTTAGSRAVSSTDITRLMLTLNAAGNASDILTLAAIRTTNTSSDTGVMFNWLELY